MTPESVSIRRAASLAGVTREDILKWIRAGKVAVFTTPGGHRRVELAEVCAEKRARSKRMQPKDLAFEEECKLVAAGKATFDDFE